MGFLGKTIAVLLWIPILIWAAGSGLVEFVFPPAPASFEPGVTFSPIQAGALGLDWEETFLSLFVDLGVKRFRIPAYWSEVEPERGEFDFARLDRIIQESEARGAKVILAAGMKLPRWPECHIPEWANEKLKISAEGGSASGGKNYEEFETSLLGYIRAVVERYKDSPAVEMWQVENEPFFKFGECPKISFTQVKKEVALVRSLDKRPIMITDSGELGIWFGAARLGDIVGTTIYRTTWKKGVGYMRYYLPAAFYEKKAALIRMFFGKEALVSEMQLEPWVSSPPISSASFEEQFKSMSFEQFKKNIAYAEASRLSPVYFWGAEWWYWMRLNGHPEFWIYVRDNVFR